MAEIRQAILFESCPSLSTSVQPGYRFHTIPVLITRKLWRDLNSDRPQQKTILVKSHQPAPFLLYMFGKCDIYMQIIEVLTCLVIARNFVAVIDTRAENYDGMFSHIGWLHMTHDCVLGWQVAACTEFFLSYNEQAGKERLTTHLKQYICSFSNFIIEI